MNTCASSYEFRSDVTAKGFYQYVAGSAVQTRHIERFSPWQDAHTVLADRRHPGQGRAVVDPQPHALASCREVGGQSPANTDVAKVINDFAENVPLQVCHHQIVHNTVCPKILNLLLNCW